MNEQQLESFLRENRPRTEEDPTFILETRRRMAEVEGIKAEVDRTRNVGRGVLIAVLVAGIAIGTFITAIAYLYPVNPAHIGEGVWDKVRIFFTGYRQYLLPALAALAVTLSLVLSLRPKSSSKI